MYTIDFNHPVHVHFIGIGGISMSGLAEVLLQKGFSVSGSDAKASDLTRHLENLGAQVFYGQRASNIKEETDVVVYTAAIHPDNPEYQEAAARALPMLTRAQLLGQMMKNYETPIAVAGTHGKTTTTSMCSHILLTAQCDPTISVGGILPAISGNIRTGHSGTFITEACEYTNSFLSFFPKISLILNMDADHLDFFKDIEDIRRSFRKFAELLPEDGTLIINADTPQYQQVTEGLACQVVTYGLNTPADYTASSIVFDGFGHPTFDCFFRGEKLGTFSLKVPGMHNVSNALASIAMGCVLSLPLPAIRDGLLSFTGTDRRFQYKGEVAGVTILMIMPITPRKSRQLCRRPSTFRTKQPGAFSSPTPTPGPKLCFRNLPELSLWPTKWCWLISMPPGRPIRSEFLPRSAERNPETGNGMFLFPHLR